MPQHPDPLDPKLPNAKKAADFYQIVMKTLQAANIPFMVGGTYALNFYTDLNRQTHDLDLFGKASDYPRFLAAMKAAKIKSELVDERWIAKATKGELLVDFIFNSASALCPVDDSWLEHAPIMTLYGVKVKVVPAEEMILSKIYYQERRHYDGADINHLILKQGKNLNWRRLMRRMEAHW